MEDSSGTPLRGNFQLRFDLGFTSHLFRDLLDGITFGFCGDGAAQSDFAIGGDDFHVAGIDRKIGLFENALPNFCGDLDVSFVFVLIDRCLRDRTVIASIDRGVVR